MTTETALDSIEPIKIPNEIANLSALKATNQPCSASKLKERKNSSQLPTCGTFTKGVRNKAQRKISFDRAAIAEDTSTSKHHESETAQNLLAEFEKDETLEPGTTLTFDSKFKVSQKHQSSVAQAEAFVDVASDTRQAETKQHQSHGQEERESFQKRADWRQTEQIQRKLSKPNVRN